MDLCLVFNFYAKKNLNSFSFFDIGKNHSYFDNASAEKTFLEEANLKHLPLLDAILKLSNKKDHGFSLFFSGFFLEMLSQHFPKYISDIKKLVKSGKIELLGGTYNNSLSCLFSLDLFKIEIAKHRKEIKSLFDCEPTCFSNTENIYSNELGTIIKELKFKSAIAPAIDWFLGDNNQYQIFQSKGEKKLSLLLTDYKTNQLLIHTNAASLLKDKSLSDKLYVAQINPASANPNTNWIDVISEIKKRKNKFILVSDTLKAHTSSAIYNIPSALAVNSSGQDLPAFIENPIQKETLEKLKSTKAQLHIKSDKKLLEDFLPLCTAENLLKMNTKINSDNITEPYDQYLSMMNILSDLEIRISKHKAT